MNSQIEAWRVQAFGANIYQLSQQRSSRLAQFCRNESFTGKVEFFDRLGLATAQDKTGRNADTPDLNITHTRRAVTTVTREWGTLVDRKDKVQNIHNPENEYSVAAQNALGRKKDAVILAAALGTAYTGEAGTSTQTLGTGQKIAAVSGGALTYPNMQLLRKAKRIFDAAEVVGQRVIAHGADFLEALLAQTEVTSADYNTVKALVNGELNQFMGFTFIHTELASDVLATTSDSDSFKWNSTTGLYDASGTTIAATDKQAVAFVSDGVILGRNPNIVARVGERNDKGYSMQVYAAEDFGAVRMEEAKVLQLIYKA